MHYADQHTKSITTCQIVIEIKHVKKDHFQSSNGRLRMYNFCLKPILFTVDSEHRSFIVWFILEGKML